MDEANDLARRSMAIKAVLFDLDETLFDRTGSLRLFLAAQWKRHPVLARIPAQKFVDDFLLRDQRGLVSKTEVYSELVPEDQDAAAALHEDYENNSWRFAYAFPGMSNMFQQLRDAGLKTGIVTNGETHIQQRTLLALGLDHMTDTTVISESAGLRKPDPEIFRLAADRLGVPPDECVFVGDSPVSDILGAQNAGMKAIWFPNGAVWPSETPGAPDAEITSLAQLVPSIWQWC